MAKLVLDRTIKTSAALSKFMNEDFVYGKNDCCHFAADVVSYVIGRRVGPEDLKLNYESEDEALALAAGSGLHDQVCAVLGAPVGFNDALDGDPTLCRIPVTNRWEGQTALGIKFNGRIYVRTLRAITSVPATRAICAWRVE